MFRTNLPSLSSISAQMELFWGENACSLNHLFFKRFITHVTNKKRSKTFRVIHTLREYFSGRATCSVNFSLFGLT